MRNIIRRSLSMLLALVMIAGMVYLPAAKTEVAAAETTRSTGGTTLTQYIQDGATLQCWNWSFNNIKANLGLIANLGYSSIQVSPPQEGKEGSVNKPFNNWWVLYQPISFNFNQNPNNAIGTRDEFIELCNEAHKYGIRVIVDVISNHLADNGGTTITPSPLIPADIRNDRSCWHNEYNVQSSNYNDRYDITQRAMRLPDLNTGNKKIQNYVLNYLKDCIDCGADGFRYDAAKQIETPDDYYTYASDFWPTVINGANEYASSTRGIMLYHYGEMLANPDESGSLPVSAYTKYMSVTENAWSNDIRHFMNTGNTSAIQYGYFKQCNADKLVLWPESHDTYWDGICNEDKSWYYGPNQQYSHEVGAAALNRTYALVASRAYAMSLYFPRPNDMLYQEMGDIAKTGWSDPAVKAVNWFKNQFAGQSEYCSTYGSFAYIERGNSGVVLINVPGGAAYASVPNHVLKAGSYVDQITGNKFTVSSDGWIYGDIGDTGVAVIYNAPTASCSHSSHGADGYCYNCYAYVGHKSGTTCSTCGTASTKTIYLDNTGNWSTPYVYGWHDSSSDAVTSGWPGNKMTKVSGNIYKATVPASATNVIFNNGSGTQTANLTPSADGDTYNFSTGFWTKQGEVFLADNYYVFGNINGADYNGTEYMFQNGELTTSFTQDSYIFICDSNGIEYFTEGWQGEVNSVTMYPGAQVTSHNRLYVPGGVQVTMKLVANSDGSLTVSYTTGASTGGNTGGNTGTTTTNTIYVDITGSGWSNVNVYAWDDTTGEYTGGWPGSAMTKVSGNIYSFKVPTSASKIIFNNGSSQTSNLNIPTDGKNQYNYSSNSWTTYGSSSGGNEGGSTGGDVTGGNVPDNLYYLFWGNSSGSLSHNEWDTPFVGGKLTVTFDETMYVWVISADGGIQYMTDGWVGNVTSAKLYPQPQLTQPNKLVIPAGTQTLTLSSNGDGSLTLAYGAGNSGNTGGNTGGNEGGTTTNKDYYLFGYINGANYGCEDDYATLGSYKFVNGKLTTTFAQDSYVAVKTGDNSNWYMFNSYCDATSGTLYNTNKGSSEKMFVPGGVEVTFTLVANSDDTLTLSYTTGGGNQGGGDDTTDVYYQLVTDIADVNAGGQFLIVAKNGTTYRMMSYTYSGTTFESTAVTVSGNKITGSNLPVFTLTPANGGFDATVGTASIGYTLSITKTTNGFKCVLKDIPSFGLLFQKSTNQFKFVGVSNANNSDFMQELQLYKYTEAAECSHSYTSKVTTAATCDKAGVKTYTCSKCGDSYTESIAATGHSYTSKVTTAATCTTAGVKTFTCSKCSNSYTESIAATGHSYSNGSCTACGAKDPNASTPSTGYVLVNSVSDITAGGEYVIVALVDGTYYAMNTTLSSGKFVGQTVTVSGNTVTGTNLPVWTIASVSGGITLSVDGSYLNYSSSTNFKFASDAYTWTVTAGDNGFIFNSAATTRGIYVQKSSTKFGAYSQTYVNSSSYVSNLLVFKNVEGGTSTECSHSYTSKVTTAATCTTAGVKTFTCSKCGASYTESIAATGHNYVNGSCTACGAADPNASTGTTGDYYLFGWINGANYGCEETWETLGEYHFVNGKLTATFAQDSYIAVKTSDNNNWFMFNEYCTATTGTLVNTNKGSSEKMFIPGGKTLNFTLVENADGSLTLSYTTGSTSTVTKPTLTLKNPTLAFEDEILYNVYFTATDLSSVVEMGMITFDTRNESGTVSNAKETIPGYVKNTDGTYTVHSNGIPAKMLSDALYFKVYAKLSDGSYVYSSMAGYHAVAYANTILNSSASSAAAKSLVVAMLNYGAAAQTNFNYKTNALMNASLTSAQKALVKAYSDSMVAAVPSVSTTKAGSFVMNGGYSDIHPTVSFEGAFSINYYFTPKNTPSNGITFYYWTLSDFNANSVLKTSNATGSVKMTSTTGVYTTAIEGIAAKAIDEPVFIAAVYTNGGTSYYTPVIGYSLGQYCKTLVSNGNAFGGATAVYGYYAKAYFAS